MESANEAGRRAANVILDATGSRATLAQVSQQREPEAFQSLRWLDTVLWHRRSRTCSRPCRGRGAFFGSRRLMVPQPVST